jgi:hypothetical protein
LGSEDFKKELLAASSQRVGPNNYGTERRELEPQRAERIIAEEMYGYSGAKQTCAAELKAIRERAP